MAERPYSRSMDAMSRRFQASASSGSAGWFKAREGAEITDPK